MIDLANYPGSKGGAGVFQTIINRIPEHDVYIEACLGGGAILRKKRPASLSIGIESVAAVVDEWLAAGLPIADFEIHNANSTSWLGQFFGLTCRTGPRRRIDRRSTRATTDSSTAAGDDGFVFNGRKHFVYWDPPYWLDARRSPRPIYGSGEMLEDDHDDLLTVARQLPAFVMISGYDCELYRDRLVDWHHYEFEAMTRGGKAVEHLWMNYDPDAWPLHDSQYLGDDRAERDANRKKLRNWIDGSCGLRSLDSRRRQQLLDTIAREFPVETAAAVDRFGDTAGR